jgi:hypothetical protein
MDNVNYINDEAFHKCQSTFWIKIPLWSRHARRWEDLLQDTPSKPYDESDEESSEDEDEDEEDNEVQDHGDASSELSFDSRVMHAVKHLIEGYDIRNDVER